MNLKENSKASERSRTGLTNSAGDTTGEKLRNRTDLRLMMLNRSSLLLLLRNYLVRRSAGAVGDEAAVAGIENRSFGLHLLKVNWIIENSALREKD